MTDVCALPDLPYDRSALEPHVSGRIMEVHHDEHHAAYVKSANATLDRLQEMRGNSDFGAIAMLEKNLGFHVSGQVLHSVFWTNLSPEGGGEPDDALRALIDDTFGGFDAFRWQITEAAGTIQGSGWALALWVPVALASSCSRSTITRATTARARCRCLPSTHGSTPTTCSTRAERPSSSTPSGTS